MMADFFVYILYSPNLDRYYIGQTEDLERRFVEHNTHYFEKSSTRTADDWQMYLSVQCNSREQSVRIETHIKKSKSRVYLENLKKYPAIIGKLLAKFQ
jgi:putative endonuclease